jgi:gamma-tubulin complex component 3
MTLLARLVEAATPLQGGGMICRLFGYSRHGDGHVDKFLRGSILQGVCNPFYHMISRWVLHGELYDPFNEFFICITATSKNFSSDSIYSTFSLDVSTADYVWHKYYTLNPSMLPPFLSLTLAKKILVVGKSINFIKVCSKYSERLQAATVNGTVKNEVSEKVTEMDGRDPMSTLINARQSETLLSMSFGKESELEQTVYSIAQVIEATLLTMVQNKFHLSIHLAALKKFMLLGQGDFVTCLLDNVGEFHSKLEAPNSIHRCRIEKASE